MTSPTIDRRNGLVGNVAMKAPVTALAASNITLSGQQTADGIAVLASNAAGVPDRVLCTAQTDGTQNGIWDVSTGPWVRSKDANGNYDLAQGSTVLVNRGTIYAGSYWRISNTGSITIGTTAIAWEQALISSLQIASFLQAGTGAVVRAAQDKMRDWLNAKDFGVVANGVTDDIAALDLATTAAITLKKKLKLPQGEISISRPWVIANRSGTVYSTVSVDIEGEKDAWTNPNTGGISMTRIVPTFNNTFAVGIQLARGSRLKDISVIGKNTVSVSGATTMVNANYVVGGCRDSRYSPYAGIVVDPFGTSVPPDGGYPGMSAFYAASAGGSSGIDFENVVASNFVVGCLLAPAPSANLTSELRFRSCNFATNKVGFAMCNNQSRNVHWFGGSVTTNLIGFDGVTYGNQTGYAPAIFGCNMSGKYLFNVKVDAGNALPIVGLHAELFSSIGFVGTGGGSSRSPVTFVGCNFKFVDFSGNFPDHHLVAGTNVNFYGGYFDVQGLGVKGPIRVFHDNASQITFNGAGFINQQLLEFWLAFSGNQQHPSQGVNFIACSVADSGGRGPGNGIAEMGGNLSYSDISGPNRSVQPLGTSARFNNSTATDFFRVGNNDALSRVSLGSLSVTAVAGGTATFTVADGTIVRTGDMVYTSTTMLMEGQDLTASFSENWCCLGLVSVVSGNDITITGTPQSFVTGTYTLFSCWWPRWHQPTTGDTNSSTSVTNVSQPGAWKVGNKIQGAGITAGTYITAIVGSTFTLSKTTSATAAGVRLFDADIYKFSGTAV